MLKVGQVKEIYEMKGAGRSIRGIAEDLGVASIGFPQLHQGGVPVIGGRPCHSARIPDHVHQVINMTDEGRLDPVQ